MKRHPSLVPLSREHQRGLFLAQALKRGIPRFKDLPTTVDGKREYALSVYKALLQHHFHVEEIILFPAIRGRNIEIDTLINELLQEHQQMHTLFQTLHNTSDLETLLHELGLLLESHIRKEERQLFERVQVVIDKEQLHALGLKLES
ncbi:MAG: hemerythrin domain-containing protein [Chloroflexi bacterium AL-W]|nr:hemerythrin domain-containing protein [Chloroflexi bacterium AL-N1]NOK65535.1 hemerythrin domain-containing protein [Chloroflexi bacterium AL-N10]NOK74523.1 hemerythrin domain-containing protein [Chloroflexi bacterium AL-N5]NOK80568.1 hemerythrin domain-containing protein [Chloroflexi bacterium AL-W]NOK88781.1 hemerythrin domain-containing protein [Chloroflexi bacterium AL-N15]